MANSFPVEDILATLVLMSLNVCYALLVSLLYSLPNALLVEADFMLFCYSSALCLTHGNFLSVEVRSKKVTDAGRAATTWGHLLEHTQS